jgi:hypothetical protein
MSEHDSTLLWVTSHGMRCELIPYFDRFQLRLLRGLQTVRTEVFVDVAHALVASSKWQRRVISSTRRVRRRRRASDG